MHHRVTARKHTRPRVCTGQTRWPAAIAHDQSDLLASVLAATPDAPPADVRLAQSHILAKLRGYQAQDAHRNPSSSSSSQPLTLQECCTLLAEHQLQCTFCHRPLLLLYPLAYEGAQWTLDRIDNSLGHTLQNVLPACLTCNLRRRRQSHHRFALKKTTYIVHRAP